MFEKIKASFKNNKKDIKKLTVLTVGAAILVTPSISMAAGELPIFKGVNSAFTSIRGSLIFLIPAATGVYIAWHALSGLGGDSHKKAEIKDKVVTGLVWGSVGTTAAAVVNWFYGFF
ncbi:hypothetical protein [Priestia megaterium]|uniref:hypothetical protein n=1 Tax=Priestia megaterium TaxID=1404 RepID=UPI0031FD288B